MRFSFFIYFQLWNCGIIVGKDILFNVLILAVSLAPSPLIPVSGVIDGNFEGGYFVTVKIDSENLKGILYQVPQFEAQGVSEHHTVPANNIESSSSKAGVSRQNKRKRSQRRRRDPAHPKQNVSGYNFFFAKQQSRLKPLYAGREREISKKIGELWNNLQETEKSVSSNSCTSDIHRLFIPTLSFSFYIMMIP